MSVSMFDVRCFDVVKSKGMIQIIGIRVSENQIMENKLFLRKKTSIINLKKEKK
jgi:hypothetical protein